MTNTVEGNARFSHLTNQPYLAPMTLENLDKFARNCIKSKKRLGFTYMTMYARNSYHNAELLFSSDAKAYAMLKNYMVTGTLRLPDRTVAEVA